MTQMQAVSTIVLSVVIPFVVQLVRQEGGSSTAARVTAIVCSVIAGIVTGFVGGIPADPEAWVTAIFATIGGVQTAYTLFKSVGVTSKWLDALLAVGAKDGE
jgi:hypothetical protein